MITIRTATARDLPALRDMIRKLCAYHGDPCHLGLAEAQARFIGGPLTALIAVEHDTPVGYAVLEPRWQPMREGDTLDIVQLFIEEPQRGQGIGRRLIAAAREIADYRKVARLTIGASMVNPGAAAAYRAMGLEEITTNPGPRFDVPLTAATA